MPMNLRLYIFLIVLFIELYELIVQYKCKTTMLISFIDNNSGSHCVYPVLKLQKKNHFLLIVMRYSYNKLYANHIL